MKNKKTRKTMRNTGTRTWGSSTLIGVLPGYRTTVRIPLFWNPNQFNSNYIGCLRVRCVAPGNKSVAPGDMEFAPRLDDYSTSRVNNWFMSSWWWWWSWSSMITDDHHDSWTNYLLWKLSTQSQSSSITSNISLAPGNTCQLPQDSISTELSK